MVDTVQVSAGSGLNGEGRKHGELHDRCFFAAEGEGRAGVGTLIQDVGAGRGGCPLAFYSTPSSSESTTRLWPLWAVTFVRNSPDLFELQQSGKPSGSTSRDSSDEDPRHDLVGESLCLQFGGQVRLRLLLCWFLVECQFQHFGQMMGVHSGALRHLCTA